MYLADFQLQIDVAKREHAAEALRNTGQLQESCQDLVPW
jgi:hypothetical protein